MGGSGSPMSNAAAFRPSRRRPLSRRGGASCTSRQTATRATSPHASSASPRSAGAPSSREIGRAACRGRGEISVGAGSFKKKKREQGEGQKLIEEGGRVVRRRRSPKGPEDGLPFNSTGRIVCSASYLLQAWERRRQYNSLRA